jgi:hypothetical protein
VHRCIWDGSTTVAATLAEFNRLAADLLADWRCGTPRPQTQGVAP